MYETHVGKTCPFCQFPIKFDSEVVACKKCHIPHHRECWQHNGGCTTFGCTEKGSERTAFNVSEAQAGSNIMIDQKDDHSTSASWAASTSPYTSYNMSPSYEVYIPTGPQIRPWVRFFARLTDVYLFSLILGLLLGLAYPLALEVNDLLFGIIGLGIFVFIEPIFLSTWGATPGKALLNVRLRKSDGRKPNYKEALLRSFNVWLRGEGLGIPIVTLVTQIYAYTNLTGEGITTWDRDGEFSVSHQIISAWRIILIIVLYIGFLAIMIMGS